MRFIETALPGAFVLELDPIRDERGFFARSFCRDEFLRHGLNPDCVQCNISFNRLCGSVRGMHYQAAPHAEAKLVRCTAGRIYDVIVDLRPDSPGYLRHVAVELDAENRRILYVPEGFAHGFQTLTDNAEVFYQMAAAYVPDAARGVRYNDPVFGIEWPLPVAAISPKDAAYPDFSPAG